MSYFFLSAEAKEVLAVLRIAKLNHNRVSRADLHSIASEEVIDGLIRMRLIAELRPGWFEPVERVVI